MPLTVNLADQFLKTRTHSEEICHPLQTEDYVVQPVEFVSPPKWHLGHSSWFFEAFILKPHFPDYRIFHEDFAFVFNSYYEAMGKRVIRGERGNLSRPAVSEVYAYRRYVTEHLRELLNKPVSEELLRLVEIGIQHEQQHQELLLTDIKYILGHNPLLPGYSPNPPDEYPEQHEKPYWIPIPGGTYGIGHEGEGFCFDNELKRHEVLLPDFEIASQPVTNQLMLDFIEDKGYTRFDLWHAEGWDWVQQEKIQAPLYWHCIDGVWHYYTLSGLAEVCPEAPLAHISYYEAFALAQWKGLRLPTEFEWEAAQETFDWVAMGVDRKFL